MPSSSLEKVAKDLNSVSTPFDKDLERKVPSGPSRPISDFISVDSEKFANDKYDAASSLKDRLNAIAGLPDKSP